MTGRRRAAVVLACAAPASWLLPATAAQASQEPPVERTAWFSAAGGGGVAAPAPTTAEDDLRVARAVETSAFSVLLFRGEGVRGSLQVSLREGSVTGTPDVVACPTVGADWAAGGNQPMDAAPQVDCAASTGYGVPSEDGLSMEFGIDSAFEVEPGTWSIALVPTPGGVAPGPPPSAPLPFSLDVVAPEPGAFVLEEAFDDTGEAPAPVAPPADAAPLESEPAAGFGFAPDPGAGFGAVPAGGSAALDAPALDPAVAAAPLAAPGAGLNPVTLPPALQATPVGVVEDLGAGRRLLALLVLAGGSAAVGYAAGQQRPGPRLIGGRARALGASVPVLTGPSAEERPRGIGRFAKVRETAPRRLR